MEQTTVQVPKKEVKVYELDITIALIPNGIHIFSQAMRCDFPTNKFADIDSLIKEYRGIIESEADEGEKIEIKLNLKIGT
jgi:hypothetical protein